jgi:GNAT superfamily N-acetyltransferase
MTWSLPVSTRQARLGDVPALVDLLRQLGYPIDRYSLSDRLERLLGRPLVHRMLVAPAPPDEGRLLGALHATRRETVESEDYTEIAALVVDESARGSGVGKALVAAAERWARDLGMPAVRVRSNVVRTSAHAFYERLGYRVLKQQTSFLKEL